MPQQTNPARKTLLERTVQAYQHGELTQTAATLRVEREGFSEVVLRFHTVNRDPIPLRFYEATPKGLVLTDALLATVQGISRKRCTLRRPVAPDLLEAAFAMHVPVEVLGTDEHMLYRMTSYEGSSVKLMMFEHLIGRHASSLKCPASRKNFLILTSNE